MSHWLCTQLSLYTAHFSIGKCTHGKVKPDKGIAHSQGTRFRWVSSIHHSLEQNTPRRNPPAAPPPATRWSQSTAPGGAGARRGASGRRPLPTAGATGAVRSGPARPAWAARAPRFSPPAITTIRKDLCIFAYYCDFIDYIYCYNILDIMQLYR